MILKLRSEVVSLTSDVLARIHKGSIIYDMIDDCKETDILLIEVPSWFPEPTQFIDCLRGIQTASHSVFLYSDFLNCHDISVHCLNNCVIPTSNPLNFERLQALMRHGCDHTVNCASVFLKLNERRRFDVDAISAGAITVHSDLASPAQSQSPLLTEYDAITNRIELPDEVLSIVNPQLVVAGGFLARTAVALGKGETCTIGHNIDIDMFVIADSEREALAVVRLALIKLALFCKERDTGMFVARSKYALTIGMDSCNYDIQIILRYFDTEKDLLSTFDIDVCRMAYDGTKTVASLSAIRAISTGWLIIDNHWNSTTFSTRIDKYCRIGFGALLYQTRADYDVEPGCTVDRLINLSNAQTPCAKKVQGRTIARQHMSQKYRTFPGRYASPVQFHHYEYVHFPQRPVPVYCGNIQYDRLIVERSEAYDHYDGSFYNPRDIVYEWKHNVRRQSLAPMWRFRQVYEHLSCMFDTGPMHMFWGRHTLKGVVFQQLDAHPFYGEWNQHLFKYVEGADATSPLPFFCYIEDALLAFGCREHLANAEIERHMTMKDGKRCPLRTPSTFVRYVVSSN